MSRIILAIVITALLLGNAVSQQKIGSSGINEATLKAHIKFLADDMLEGRGTGARGGELAAKYIAAQLEAVGAKGAGENGSFFQPVSLVGVKADPATTLTISGASGSESFKFADDFVAFTGAQTELVDVDADLVFVGYGINAPEQKWNDYKGADTDYRGKILVMLVNDPPATTAEPNLFSGKTLTYYGRWTYKYEEAARRGAAGAILLHTDQSAGYPWSVVRTSNGSWRFDIARGQNDSTPFLQFRSWVTDDAARRLMKLAGQDLDALRAKAATREFQPVKLGLKGKLNLKSEVKRVAAPNVVGILEGSDPQLRNEYVVYSAHWDHLGVGAPNKDGDTIYNGALDNASGVAVVLAIAETIAKMPPAQQPKRSSLFLFPTAEEQGLLGAEWYAKHPVVPLDKTAANVNLDSMNVLGPTQDFIPLGAERSTLKAVVDSVAKNMGLRVSPDARPEQGSFYRSDHFPFAKAGVPSISLKEGNDYVGRSKEWGEEQFRAYNTAHYHQPSDEIRDTWDYRGMIQEGEIALAIGRMIADAPEKPRFNPGDEFARKP
ncbi:MAG TPA: M28 family peptidase [Pyrinomonadaceae bacterium]|jgi:Zn-dependent M28 family amino/carboxypeptidase|nr:M28 family peptidase [Pyrinomonadaceae bacterium]